MQQFFLHCAASSFIFGTFMLGSVDLKADSALRYLFGSEPVSHSMQAISTTADTITHFKTPVYKMNWLTKKLGYSSFNWFNTTWLDEEAIQSNDELQTLWQLIHEKYHTLAGHDTRRLVGASAIALPIIQGLMYTFMDFFDGGDIPIIPFVLPNGLPAASLALFLFLWHEEYCERQADAYADHIIAEIR